MGHWKIEGEQAKKGEGDVNQTQVKGEDGKGKKEKSETENCEKK